MKRELFTRSVQCIAAAALAFTGMQAFGAIATIDAVNIQDNTERRISLTTAPGPATRSSLVTRTTASPAGR